MKTDNLITGTNSSDVALTLIGLSMSITSLMIVVLNIGVLLTYFKNKNLRIPSNYFIVSLAVSDIIIGVVPTNLYTAYMIKERWPLDGGTCRLWLCIDHWCLTVSILTVMGVAFDRYFAVCLPSRHRVFHTKRNVKLVIASLWIFAFLLWVPAIIIYPYIVGVNAMSKNQCYIQFTFESPAMAMLSAVMTYYLPLVIIVILYSCICFKLQRMSKTKLGQYKHPVISTSTMGTTNRSYSDTFQENNNRCIEHISSTGTAETGSISSEKGESERKIAYCRKNSPLTITPESGDNKTLFVNSSDTLSKLDDQNVNQKTSINVNSISENGQQKREICPEKEIHRGNRNDKRGVKHLLFVILAFAFTWIPYFVGTTLLATTRIHIPEHMWRFCYIFGWLNSLLNPLCYAFGNRNFMNGYKKLLRDAKKGKKTQK